MCMCRPLREESEEMLDGNVMSPMLKYTLQFHPDCFPDIIHNLPRQKFSKDSMHKRKTRHADPSLSERKEETNSIKKSKIDDAQVSSPNDEKEQQRNQALLTQEKKIAEMVDKYQDILEGLMERSQEQTSHVILQQNMKKVMHALQAMKKLQIIQRLPVEFLLEMMPQLEAQVRFTST